MTPAETRGESGGGPSTAAELFEILWGELVGMLGTTAAATLVRRAAKRACARDDELGALQVVREGWDYRYSLPRRWTERPAGEVPALAELVRSELIPLLREFTGDIVLRRLGRSPELRALGFPGLEER